MRARATNPLQMLLLGAGLAACSEGPLALHAPDIATAGARTPSLVEVEPIVLGEAIVGDYTPPGPASVLTAAINAELKGRALHGGESGGYDVRCKLDRFAPRRHASMTESQERLALYIDLSCEAFRAVDHVMIWRGELRSRTLSETANVLASDVSARQRLLDRALSDASRELASDLAIRALGLQSAPSARVFADEGEQRLQAGLDDTPFGPAALEETGGMLDRVIAATTDARPGVRAAAWNVVAMAAGPGDPWIAQDNVALDEDPGVRFIQYKALSRAQSAGTLQQLRSVAPREGDSMLSELLADSIGSGGTGLARSRK